MPKICPWYAQDISKIGPRYTQDMSKISPKCAQYMPKISPKYAKYMSQIWHHYPVALLSQSESNIWQWLTKCEHDWLTESPTWIQEILAHLTKRNVTVDKGALSGKKLMEHVVKKVSKCDPTKFGNTQKGPTSSSGTSVAHPGCVSHHNYSSSHNRIWVSINLFY